MNCMTDGTLKSWPQNIYILLPAYNAGNDLFTFLPALLNCVPSDHICIVDDGSRDNTGALCHDYKVDYLKLIVNRGKGAALRKGFNYLIKNKSINWILTMDADGQHAVEDIQLFLGAIEKHPESGIIIGSRKKSVRTMPVARIFSNVTTSKVLSLICRQKILDSQCGYRAYSSQFIENITIHYDRFEMESEVILKACFMGFPIHFIPVQTLYCSSQSHISHVIDILRWIRAIVGVWINTKQLNSLTKGNLKEKSY